MRVVTPKHCEGVFWGKVGLGEEGEGWWGISQTPGGKGPLGLATPLPGLQLPTETPMRYATTEATMTSSKSELTVIKQ